MERKMPRPGEIYDHFKDKPYQIITVALDSETGEQMVVYQALYGDFKTYVRPLTMFMSEVDHVKYPEIKQQYRFELREQKEDRGKTEASKLGETRLSYADSIVPTVSEGDKQASTKTSAPEPDSNPSDRGGSPSPEALKENILITTPDGEVSLLLMKFLDADSYSKKLEILTSNRKHLNDRMVTDMAVALDLAVDEGPLEQRISGLIYCLQAMCRFEDRRLR